jgi:hypothetical protein
MKKIVLVMFVMVLFFIATSKVSAQIGISINLNLQPQWGPVDNDYVEYYYLPEYDIYYNAPVRKFIYRKGNKWVTVSSLPSQYRNIDLYSTYKVVINEHKPYLRNDYYASHYKEYKNVHSKQVVIRDSQDSRYNKGNGRRNQSGYNRQEKQQHKNMRQNSRERDDRGEKNNGKGNKNR